MSSKTEINGAASLPVSILQYRDMAGASRIERNTLREKATPAKEPPSKKADIELSQEEFAACIKQEQEKIVREVEAVLKRQYEEKLALAESTMKGALRTFNEQREDYFARVEAEVVQLALSIAAKILHREAQVDPMLVAGLVRVAIEKMKEGASVTVRVSPARVTAWQSYFSAIAQLSQVEVVGEEKHGEFDCTVETELGSASFGLDKQLKEIEQGFFDLLALRPSKP